MNYMYTKMCMKKTELESKYKVNVMRTTDTFVDSKTFYLPLSPMKEKFNSCTCKFEVN